MTTSYWYLFCILSDVIIAISVERPGIVTHKLDIAVHQIVDAADLPGEMASCFDSRILILSALVIKIFGNNMEIYKYITEKN